VRGGDPRALVVVFLFAAWAPLLVVHELGHALCAWSVGWRVREIVVGYGRGIAQRRSGGRRSPACAAEAARPAASARAGVTARPTVA
jgi:membrane-associated protease RseP (regulator of RpoE activity)